jgi:fructose-1,6-bisphosphatase/inositol monophosphatase family enzyme
VCCGVDYPKIAEGDADYAIYSGTKPWDHAPGSLLLAEAGGYVGTFDAQAYRPQVPVSGGLVTAADRATYDLVQGLISDLPGL